MEAKLEVGKPCVCVKTHPERVVKAGEVNEVLGLKKESCGCIVVDIGKVSPNLIGWPERYICPTHGPSNTTRIVDGVHWLCSTRFSPIESLTEGEVDAMLDNILNEKETV